MNLLDPKYKIEISEELSNRILAKCRARQAEDRASAEGVLPIASVATVRAHDNELKRLGLEP